jgi:hypothetical protein
MTGMKYRGWTNSADQMILLNSRHIVRAIKIEDELIEVYLADGTKDYVKTTLGNFESWLIS